jgi:hypothetical protein
MSAPDMPCGVRSERSVRKRRNVQGFVSAHDQRYSRTFEDSKVRAALSEKRRKAGII